VSLVWTETRSEAKGWKSIASGPGAPPDPPVAIDYTLSCRIFLDGDKWYYGFDKASDKPQNLQGEVLLDYQAAFNGETFRQLSGPTGPKRRFPQGDVRHKAPSFSDVYFLPALWFFRLPSKPFEHDFPNTMSLARTEGIVENHRCVIVQQGNEVEGRNSYWIDPENDCVIRRYQFIQDEVVIIQIDISYSDTQRADIKLVPRQWSIVIRNNKGGPQVTAEAQVDTCSIGEAVSGSHFEVPFPDGTVVYQDQEPKQYIIQAGGTILPFTDAEIATMDYDALMRSYPQKSYRLIIIIILLGACALGGLLLVYKGLHYFRSRAPTP
jgi:hypothetical protein